MIALALIAAAALQAPAEPAASAHELSWSAAAWFVRGDAYAVTVEIALPVGGGAIPAWMTTAAGLEIDGRALGERGGGTLHYSGATRIALTLDVGGLLGEAPDVFRLTHAGAAGADGGVIVRALTPAPAELDFMKIEPERLGEFLVQLDTNRGRMLFELWPDVAPNHVRNFLDLCYTGFYDGLIFHRVWPGFMIQGGDPGQKERPKPPRSVDREFSDRKHVPGVLSMARTNHPDSATSQFFVLHAAAPGLDGQYSVFGKLVKGFDVVDGIATAPGEAIPDLGGFRPREEQTILRATVLHAKQGDA